MYGVTIQNDKEITEKWRESKVYKYPSVWLESLKHKGILNMRDYEYESLINFLHSHQGIEAATNE